MSGLGVALGVASSVLGGILGGSRAKRAEAQAKQEAARLQSRLATLEANRQPIINPYEGITDLSSMATDYSNQFSNPYANLSVATQAAEMQIEQTDIALANTLDTLAQTGGGAGGATALAKAAAASKKQVAASIEQQEAQNVTKQHESWPKPCWQCREYRFMLGALGRRWVAPGGEGGAGQVHRPSPAHAHKLVLAWCVCVRACGRAGGWLGV